jgi:hypothetical protein
MNRDEFCEHEPITPMEKAWKYGGDFEKKIFRDELFTLSDISFNYGVCHTEILLSPEFPLPYMSPRGGWLFPKKEVEAFLKKNKHLLKGKNEDE